MRVILPVLLLTAALLPGDSPVAGVKISGVPVDLAERLTPLVVIQNPDHPAPGRIRDTIRLIMLSGIAAGVDVYDAQGEVIVSVAPRVLLESIRVRGHSRRDTLAAAGLEEDRWFWPDELTKRPRQRLVEHLRTLGFLRASVQFGWEKRGYRSSLEIVVTKGPRDPVREIRIQGDPDRSLVHPLYQLIGRAYRPTRARKRLDRLIGRLRQEGFLEAEGRMMDVEVRDGGASVGLEVKTGRRIGIRFLGDPLPRSLIRRMRKTVVREGLAGHTAETLLRDFTDGLKEKGYLQARVNASIVTDDDPTRAWWVVMTYRGSRYRLRRVVLEGVTVFPEDQIVGLLGIEPGRYVRSGALDVFRDAVENFYVQAGYLDVSVDKPLRTLDRDAGMVDIRLAVDEGPLLQVGTVALEKCESCDADASGILSLRSGDPMREEDAARDLAELNARLLEAGYAQGRVVLDTERIDGKVNLTFRCEAGERYRAGKVLFRGLQRVDRRAVEDAVRIREGDILSRGALNETQEALYSTGLFRRVDILPVHSLSEEHEEHVLVDVDEDRTRALMYGIGYDTEDRLRLQLGYSMSNLFGRRHYLGFAARLSGREKNFRVTYRIPNTFGWPYPTSWVLLRTEEKWTGFDLVKENAYLEFSREWGERGRGFLRIQYSRQDPFRLDGNLASLGLDRRSSTLGPILSYVHDSRSDPLFPRKGRFFAVETMLAVHSSSTSDAFFKWFLHHTVHLPLSRRSTLVLSGRAGGIHNRGPHPVPLGERFFAGGRSSLRAFARDTLGIEGETLVDGTPAGGAGILLGNLEWRVLAGQQIGFSVFLDGGNVFSDVNDVSFKRLRTGAGAGVFFLTPVGPLRLEYGRKLDPAPGESKDQWYMSLGFPF